MSVAGLDRAKGRAFAPARNVWVAAGRKGTPCKAYGQVVVVWVPCGLSASGISWDSRCDLSPGTAALVMIHYSCSWHHPGHGAALRGQHYGPPLPGQGWARCECRGGADLARSNRRLKWEPDESFLLLQTKSQPEWEALLFAWHYLHDAFGKAAVPFTLEKSITRLPQAPCAILCIARCSSYAHHGLSRLRSRTSKNPLGESTWFSFLPLTVDQRPNQGKEEWGDGSGVGTTGEEEEGKGITLNWCWKSSFHKCETIMCGIFKVQLSNPKVGLFFFK